MIPAPPLELLSPFERLAFRLVRRMNRGAWQRFWFAGQRRFGARWIEWVTGPLLEVHGLEHVAATSRGRPLLLVANHRTFFDLYLVMSTLFRRLPGWRSTIFPVRGRYYYQTLGGLALNAFAAWWSMYPPFFHVPSRRRFDAWSLDELAGLCREGPGRLVGFHPEGMRNLDPDPYALLPAQSGVGRLIHTANPQVVPVFIAGLSNSVPEIWRRSRRGGERIRLWFGEPIDFNAQVLQSGSPPRYREIAEYVMSRIANLALSDRRSQTLSREATTNS